MPRWPGPTGLPWRALRCSFTRRCPCPAAPLRAWARRLRAPFASLRARAASLPCGTGCAACLRALWQRRRRQWPARGGQQRLMRGRGRGGRRAWWVAARQAQPSGPPRRCCSRRRRSCARRACPPTAAPWPLQAPWRGPSWRRCRLLSGRGRGTARARAQRRGAGAQRGGGVMQWRASWLATRPPARCACLRPAQCPSPWRW